jgi:Predicted periplasmic or secreted lipoprotein
MKILSKIALCLALFMSGSVSAYYYHSGYYNLSNWGTYYSPGDKGQSDISEGDGEDFWIQGSLNPFSLITTVVAFTYTQTNPRYSNYSNYSYPALKGSDSEIEGNVREKLSTNTRLATGGKNINISVSYGKVTLTGTVSSPAEKSLAASTARKVTGVTTVNNQLNVLNKY